MSCNTAVLPPANGKKLWRVKRSVSSSSTSSTSNQSQPSVECLNSSLKIAAAGSKFSIRRPPMRRPKNKPGKPKDFVFVDLSPVKSDEEAQFDQSKIMQGQEGIASAAATAAATATATAAATATATATATLTPPTPFNEQLPSPTVSIEESIFELPALNEYDEYNASRSSLGSAGSGETTPSEELGLGIMNLGVDWNQPQPIQQQQPQPQSAQQQMPQMSQEFISQQLYGYQQAMLQQHLQIQQLQQQLFEQQQRAIESQIISATSTPALPQQPQFQQLQSPFKEPQQKQQPQQTPSLPATKTRKTAGQLQFKTYQPKHQRSASEACIKKPVRKPHHRTYSVPFTPVQPQQQQQPQQYSAMPMQSVDSSCSDVSLDDFMLLNDQISMNLNLNQQHQHQQQQLSSFTPVSEYSEEYDDKFATAGKPNSASSITACGFEELFLQTYSNINVKDNEDAGEFEMGTFVI
ncbi:hypothetical protein KGF57_003100 [Candida theae]|uniref:Uncharacterized protein n=1 Tax=Candida theae TaxID=1198502 RepID=A0AAD5FYH4_9ASCO|nr:uncharacterized protein KGF57_003100 [Candida theae]KAI5957833.1 hypothetical protein KGF57_003100 [Candida theae]